MALRVVGAGLGRTGTQSMKLALEQVLGGPCYHMHEVFLHPEHVELWQRAVHGELPDWDQLYDGYAAAVDWPSVAFWRELADEYPDAKVLLTTRDTDAWWRSVDSTIFVVARAEEAPDAVAAAHLRMAKDMLTLRFTPGWSNEREAKAAYERHNADVRATVAPERLIEWRPGDGWDPICRALSVAPPDTPFPHVNTGEEFRANLGV